MYRFLGPSSPKVIYLLSSKENFMREFYYLFQGKRVGGRVSQRELPASVI